MKIKKDVFLARDGVINKDIGDYTYRIKDFSVLPGTVEFIRKMKENGYLVIVITNQGGISKGLYDHDAVNKVHDHLERILKEQNIVLDEIYYCPHHIINEKCLCRKPGSLLIEKALARFVIDPTISFMIGDRKRDLDAGEAAGVKGILVEQNAGLSTVLHHFL